MDFPALFKKKIYEDPEKDRRFKEWALEVAEAEKDAATPHTLLGNNDIETIEKAGTVLNGLERDREDHITKTLRKREPLADNTAERRVRTQGGFVNNTAGAQLRILEPVIQHRSNESDKIGARLQNMLGHAANQTDKYLAHEQKLHGDRLALQRSANTQNMIGNLLNTAVMGASLFI